MDVLVKYHKLYLVCFNMEQWLFELAKALYMHEFLDPQQSVCNRCLCLFNAFLSRNLAFGGCMYPKLYASVAVLILLSFHSCLNALSGIDKLSHR